ncbi:MAG: exopolyphosphatase [Bradymonadia bacterium]
MTEPTPERPTPVPNRGREQVEFATVDLGSNSFHMVVARETAGGLVMVDKLRERVQLGAGLDAQRRLTAEAQRRALACLARFGQRLKHLPQDHVRVVGTNTLRRAKDSGEFIKDAEKSLGHRIEIISGREEARLIYLGVVNSETTDAHRRLVVDIGGGSTECVIGEEERPTHSHSLHMGCVTYSKRFFPGGAINAERFHEAEIAARLELRTIQARFRVAGWHRAFGSSGTATAVAQVLQEHGWQGPNGEMTPEGLNRFKDHLIERGHTNRLQDIPGLKPERATVICGGLAILIAVFEGLRIQQMWPASGALREGLLYDLLGRVHQKDVRENTVARMMERYQIDLDQAERVEASTWQLFEGAMDAWDIDPARMWPFVRWAARMYEIGLSVAYSGYHKHGAYLLANSDMPGFSKEDQALLAAFVRTHRRKLIAERFEGVSEAEIPVAIRACVLLRLGVRLNRSRSPEAQPEIEIFAGAPNTLKLKFPEGWLDDHPLTRADLEGEVEQLNANGFDLEVS